MSFEDRQKAHEKAFEKDQELRFKAEARRNRKLADWAAELMDLPPPEGQAYRTALQAADFEEAGDDDVFRKLRADFDAHSVDISDHRIRRRMDEALSEAVAELKGN